MRNIDIRDRSSHFLQPCGLIRLLGLGLALAAAGAQAQTVTAEAPPPPASVLPDDHPLTWHGITLYGIVDIGVQWDLHSAPFSDYYPAGSADVVQKNSNGSVVGLTPSNLSQSRIGLQGKEPLGVADLSAVFKLETFFNPQSGQLSDALKSMTSNNGKSLTQQSVQLDSSVAGQAFQQAFAGFSSPTWGTFTFGRQNTTLADGISKYDPQAASQAFSLIGLSGTTAGGGVTQDRRLDSSIKYSGRFADFAHLGLMYKFSNGNAEAWRNGGGSGEAYTAFEGQIGADYAGASIDAYYTRIKDAILAAPLSASQFAGLPALGYSSSNSLSGTVSDNDALAIMALYNFGELGALNGAAGPTVYGAWERITYMNPSIPLSPGFVDMSGYLLAYVNNTAYAKNDKVLQVYWAGVKYPIVQNFDVTLAYYGYKQNSYASGANAGCSSTVSSACSGNLNAASIAGDYRFTKRFDAYAGLMWTNVTHGLANGYLNTTNIDPTIGVRYSF